MTSTASNASTASTRRSGERLDRLALLEEERRFLLRSLRDLEREHDAGDVDEVDYATLKDGYTVRAAAVLRQIDHGREQLAPKLRRRWAKTALIAMSMFVIAVGIGFALASAWGERNPGDGLTGSNPADVGRSGDVTRSVLSDARVALTSGNFPEANRLFLQASQDEQSRGGENAEAIAYVGWTYALMARSQPETDQTAQSYDLALAALAKAIDIDGTYADPYCFVAIIEYNFRDDATAALPFVEQCETLDPPADMQSLIGGFADEIRAAAS